MDAFVAGFDLGCKIMGVVVAIYAFLISACGAALLVIWTCEKLSIVVPWAWRKLADHVRRTRGY